MQVVQDAGVVLFLPVRHDLHLGVHLPDGFEPEFEEIGEEIGHGIEGLRSARHGSPRMEPLRKGVVPVLQAHPLPPKAAVEEIRVVPGGENIGIGSCQTLIHQDAIPRFQSRPDCQLRGGGDPDAGDDELGPDRLARVRFGEDGVPFPGK